ncbi:MAG TPA: M20 family metallopeptidase [Bacteroidales bacterium]|nr:M20 family metallopeptidase [Bacteroidales bacterium]
MDVVSLTRKLLSFNTINPPGNEADIALFTGSLLAENGFMVQYHEFGENRLHLVAERGLSIDRLPLVLSGHFDTVPLGAADWSVDPFAGPVKDGRIWGRGSSDMKGAIAAMIIGSLEAFRESVPGGVRFIITAGEELGCQGISSMADKGLIPPGASAVIVGEPTGNIPATGHKGALYLNASAKGKTAHSSMPQLGENAIYKIVDAISRIRDLNFPAEQDPLLGYPTLNIGKISGGMNINSVPDHASFTIDVRSTTKMEHSTILNIIQEAAGKEISFEKLVDIGPVFTPIDHSFVKTVNFECKGSGLPFSLPYLTDGAVLQKTLKAPVVILGPGEADQAHKTDEWCDIEKLRESVRIYRNIISKWSKKND